MTAVVQELAHEALLYRNEEHLVAVAVPFLREGIAAGEIVVVVTGHNDLLREALGADADLVEFVDPVGWFERPAATFAAYRAFVDERVRAPGARARVLAEAVWATRSPDEVSEWQRLEAVVNVAFAAAPMRVVCCYDRRSAPAALQDAAAQTHPAFADLHSIDPSDGYEDPARFIDDLERSLELPAPHPSAMRVEVGADLARARAIVRDAAAHAGLPEDRREEAVLVVHELLINQLKYSTGDPELVAWSTDDAFVCEVRDGTGSRPHAFAGYVLPDDDQLNGRGLALVRQLADGVHVARRPDHSTIRTIFRR